MKDISLGLNLIRTSLGLIAKERLPRCSHLSFLASSKCLFEQQEPVLKRNRGKSKMITKPEVKRKPTLTEKQGRNLFCDYKMINLRGGNGGNGGMFFTSLPCNEWAGPDGGDGGNGGHIIFEATDAVTSLHQIKGSYQGQDGEKGGNFNCFGKNAEHLLIEVPIGTKIKTEDGKLLCDLFTKNQRFIGARGGAGGHGNRYFLSNENRAPTVYEEGGLGQQRRLILEMSVIAHVGLVGFPNAGKSTLLRAVSNARPLVAPYPFTTLRPHLGMIPYSDHTKIAVADIPGLIKGAHLNFGLGHDFLRHIQRCLFIIYILDLSDDAPWDQLKHLQEELENYEEGLSLQPSMIVANKIDLPNSLEQLERLKEAVNLPVIPISAKYHRGIDDLTMDIKRFYEEQCGNVNVDPFSYGSS